jgi:hypothetical protein
MKLLVTDAFLSAFPDIYHKTDSVKFRLPVKWRQCIALPPIVGQPVIITGHSDYDINDSDVDYYKPRIWWCVNKQTRKQNVHSIPLGIKNNDYQFFPENKEMGDKSLFIEMMQTPRPDIQKLMYINFDCNTHPDRRRVFDMFKNNPDVTVDARTTMRNYLSQLKCHKFVLCPRGNGVDTHRLWEALYMGCIPIVQRDIAMEDFYDMPICFIDSWDEVTEQFLESAENNVKNHNTEKLKMSYWIHRILSYSH